MALNQIKSTYIVLIALNIVLSGWWTFGVVTEFVPNDHKFDSLESESPRISRYPAKAMGGGLDGSGGNFEEGATKQIVLHILKDEWTDLPIRLEFMEKNLRYEDEFIYDYRFGKSAYALMKKFFTDESPYLLSSATLNKNIVLYPQTKNCKATGGPHNASALGDPKNGRICFNYKSLIGRPEKEVRIEIFALLIHELAHLVRFDEAEAQQIQSLISKNRLELCKIRPRGHSLPKKGFGSIFYPYETLPRSHFAKFASESFLACDEEKLEKQKIDFLKSPYWQKQASVLLDFLSQKGDVNMVEKFFDGLSFVEVTPKFRQEMMTYEKYQPRPHDIGVWPVETNFGDSTVAAFEIIAPSGSINKIIGKTGTNAQCSHKHLLANLFALIEQAAYFGTTTDFQTLINMDSEIQKRIFKEEEILDHSNLQRAQVDKLAPPFSEKNDNSEIRCKRSCVGEQLF